MATPTLAQICDAIASTLGAATGVTYNQSYNELTEAITDMPMLQVYPEDGQMDARGGNDRTTFRGGVRQVIYTIHADLYARQRSAGIGEEMGALLPLVEAIMDVLRAQDTQDYFALDGLQAFGPVSMRRVTFTYGEAQYIGARFVIPVRVW